MEINVITYQILLAVNTGLIGIGLWLLYRIWDGIVDLKVFAGIANQKLGEHERRLENIESIRALRALEPHKR